MVRAAGVFQHLGRPLFRRVPEFSVSVTDPRFGRVICLRHLSVGPPENLAVAHAVIVALIADQFDQPPPAGRR